MNFEVAKNENVKTKKSFISSLLKRSDISVIIATLFLILVFAITTESFLSSYNIFNVSRTASLYLFVALGQAIVIIIGGMNIALGAIGGICVVAFGYSVQVLGMPSWAAVIVAILVGGICGLLNGFVVVKLKLNSFVVTLASSFIFTGLVNGISKGYPYTKIPISFTTIGREGFLGMPYLFWLMIVTLVIVWYVFKYTVIGRQILVTGGNEVAARMSGIKTNNIILLCHVLSGVFAGLAGVLWISRLGSAPPSTGGDWMIFSFAVAIIGGTALSGGEITALGLFAASFMIALINNGLIMMNVNVYFEQTFLGIIIMLAIFFESFRLKFNSYKKI
ncbi:ABC transporter permease [Clostridium thailandense]|uniref:ABC transporter permease n=1 Tax=Clostridium thailandense TaxID=2794346 RepID=UPI003989FF57